MRNNCLEIKRNLEAEFDIPFHVEEGKEYNDVFYRIWPENDLGELFEITILFKNNIRMILEMIPQKFSAGMIQDMQNADLNKQKAFVRFIQEFKKRKSKLEIFINDVRRSDISELWNEEWKYFRIRATKIPISESDDFDVVSVATDWLVLASGLVLSLLNVDKLDMDDTKYIEGGVHKQISNRYERNPINRQLCLLENGYSCKICGMNFEEEYGDLGKNFIHVHHIEMISSNDEAYYINPEKDLIPVCPNCHAMLHRTTPPLLPDTLKEIIKNNKHQ